VFVWRENAAESLPSRSRSVVTVSVSTLPLGVMSTKDTAPSAKLTSTERVSVTGATALPARVPKRSPRVYVAVVNQKGTPGFKPLKNSTGVRGLIHAHRFVAELKTPELMTPPENSQRKVSACVAVAAARTMAAPSVPVRANRGQVGVPVPS